MGLVTLLYSILCGSVTWKPLFTQTRMVFTCMHVHTCTRACAHTHVQRLPTSSRFGEREGAFAAATGVAMPDGMDSFTRGCLGPLGSPGSPRPPSLPRGRPLPSSRLAFPVWPGRGVFLSQGSCIRERKSILSSWDGTCYVSPAGKPRCPMRHLLGDPGGHVAPPASRHPQVESHRASLNLFSLRTDHGPRRPGPATCVTSCPHTHAHGLYWPPAEHMWQGGLCWELSPTKPCGSRLAFKLKKRVKG